MSCVYYCPLDYITISFNNNCEANISPVPILSHAVLSKIKRDLLFMFGFLTQKSDKPNDTGDILVTDSSATKANLKSFVKIPEQHNWIVASFMTG